MSKVIIYDSDAKKKILDGVNKLEKAVSCTLGPAGKNVIIDEYGSIHSTKDGVTVAKSISLKDKFENLGANALREVAEKSNDRVGDGTTTSTILAASIYRNGLKYVSLGSNATQVKNGIKKASDKAVELVRSMSKKISSKEDIKRVAVVSANGDEKIGEMIADAMDKIGNDGTIKVQESKGLELTSKIVEGMVIDKSYVSNYLVTNPETMEAELDKPYVLIVDRKVASLQEIMNTLQTVAKTGRPLFVIAESYADEVLGSLVMTKLRGGMNSVLIESPSFGENRKNILDDIAILTAGRVVSEATGTRLENAVPGTGILGEAQKVVVSRSNTVIIGGAGLGKPVETRAAQLREHIKASQDEFEKEKLQERLAKLTSGIGIITVGATTDAERKELRDRVDDAFCAAKAAIREGIVAGGGSTLLMTKQNVEAWASETQLVGDESVGAKIFCDSLEAPIRKILENAGIDSSAVVSKLLERGTENDIGYDVVSKDFRNMVDAGIIDPAEVVINEIQNAASVASLLLTTEALVVEDDAPKAGQEQPMPAM